MHPSRCEGHTVDCSGPDYDKLDVLDAVFLGVFEGGIICQETDVGSYRDPIFRYSRMCIG
jgi:hypothetical protein